MPNAPTETKKVSLSAEETTSSFFDTEYLKADLKGRSVRGGAVTMAAQGMKFFLQMGSTVVLARLLTPQDFGLIAMVTVVTGFVLMFKDMGLSMATVQKAEINHAQISTLFWINVGLSLCVMVVIATLAPVIAWFYNEPRLAWITLALAGAFIFGGLTVQHQALLRRQMQFRALAIVEIISMSVGIATAIIAAWYGAGYWALVLMQLATAITSAIAVWVACGWRPGLPVRRSGVREMLAFGGNLTGFGVMNYFARNADNLLIGKFCGSGPLGLYSKAYGLLMLPLRQINAPLSAVAIPALSRLQNEPERYRNYYKRAINFIAFVTMPLVFVMAALSDEIIRIVLGAQWMGAAVIFKVLAFSAVIQPILNTAGWIYVSLGQTDRMMRWGLISCPIIVLSFLIGIPWGVLGVAVSYTICMSLIIPLPCLFLAFRYSPIKISDCFVAIIRPLLISIIMYIVVEIICYHLGPIRPVLILLYGLIGALAAIVLLVLFWPKLRFEICSLVKILKLLSI